MKYRFLGRTGVQVSRLCYGTMSFGGDADEHMSAQMFARCRDAGINFFDCANVYAGGRSEEILGKLIAPCRDEIVLTSKGYAGTGPDINARGSSRRNLTMAVDASLKRLGTDRIDIYFLHGFDTHAGMDETLRALDDLVAAGKILYPAVSNWAAWQIAKALGISARESWAPFECIQPMYSLAKRQAEVEILPLAQDAKLGVTPYSPLGGGLLSGKYTRANRPAGGRLLESKIYSVRYGDESYYDLAERFTDYAVAHKIHPATLAVAWVMHHPAITAPIIGARNVEQLEPSLAAADVEMTPDWRAEISALGVDPPVATDRTEEKAAGPSMGTPAK